MRLFDTNILVDVFTEDPTWLAWSTNEIVSTLGEARRINTIIYAELAPGFADPSILDSALAKLEITFADIPPAAAFRAGRAHAAYRRAGGSRARVLPDFLIGAHAAALGIPLVTRDPRRYRTYFPDLVLVAPTP
jgi:predicted nucleic acid-binding protein